MYELLFGVFILSGFLIGTVFLGYIFNLALIKLPKLIKTKRKGESEVPIQSFIRIIVPCVGSIIASVTLLIFISKYLTIYQKSFYCGITLSIIFGAHTLIVLHREQ